MLRSMLTAAVLATSLALIPTTASAQGELALTPDEVEALDDAHTLRDAGAGLTLGGVGLTGLGVGLMFGLTGFENWSGAIVGGLFEGLGGLAALIGIPTWIAGGVRSDVLSRRYDDRASVGHAYEVFGITTTAIGIALCAVGGGLLTAAMTMRDVPEGAVWTGVVTLPIGYFLATFIGAPLWAEGGRF